MRIFFTFIILQFFSQSIDNKTFVIKKQLEESYQFKPLVNYEQAFSEAKESNKKLFIYFTAYGDVNSRRMEEESFTISQVKLLLEKNYLCFNVYLDDPTNLPIKDQYFSKALNKNVKTIGQKFQDFQLTKFKNNKHPHFLIIGKNDKVIRQKIGYQNKKDFVLFLKIGTK
jgi:thioredoxin-related protein